MSRRLRCHATAMTLARRSCSRAVVAVTGSFPGGGGITDTPRKDMAGEYDTSAQKQGAQSSWQQSKIRTCCTRWLGFVALETLTPPNGLDKS